MGWYGLKNAILAHDEDEITAELSPRRNPNDPVSALYVAALNMSDEQLRDALAWADSWLRNSDHDCLRARGDARWQAVNLVHNMLRARLRSTAEQC